MRDNVQLEHNHHRPSDRKFPLSLIANDMNSPLNVGSLFRLADALGIEKIYLCGDTPQPPNSKITKTSRASEKYVDYQHHADPVELITTLKKSGSLIISLEISSASIAIDSIEFQQRLSAHSSYCLILGAEDTGVSDELLALSDMTVHIPMHGKNSSMNVVSAASIACYEITRNMS